MPTSKVRTITPAYAAQLLENNPRNRHISESRVRKFAAAMKRGEWKLNGETIIVAKDGQLMNGQNRLTAVVEAQATIQSFVVEGVDFDAMHTLDTGRNRNFGDVLKIEGEVNVLVTAATVSVLWRWSNGVLRSKFTPTTTQSKELFEHEADAIREAVALSEKYKKTLGSHVPFSQSVMAAAIMRMRQIDAPESNRFWDRISTGLELSAGDPEHALRQFFYRRVGGRSTDTPQWLQLALTIKAWNNRKEGRETQYLRMVDGEKFPILKR